MHGVVRCPGKVWHSLQGILVYSPLPTSIVVQFFHVGSVPVTFVCDRSKLVMLGSATSCKSWGSMRASGGSVSLQRLQLMHRNSCRYGSFATSCVSTRRSRQALFVLIHVTWPAPSISSSRTISRSVAPGDELADVCRNQICSPSGSQPCESVMLTTLDRPSPSSSAGSSCSAQHQVHGACVSKIWADPLTPGDAVAIYRCFLQVYNCRCTTDSRHAQLLSMRSTPSPVMFNKDSGAFKLASSPATQQPALAAPPVHGRRCTSR
jgi:hypothetical protein